MAWPTVRHAWGTFFLAFSNLVRWKSRKLRFWDLLATFLDTFLDLNLLWLEMSFLITEAALARIFASSEKTRFFKAYLSKFCNPSLKTKPLFFPSDCSCDSWKCPNKRIFSFLLLTDVLYPRSSRRFSYKEWSSENLNILYPYWFLFSM